MKMPKIKQSENEVKKAIKNYLEVCGWKVRRINNAGIKRNDAKGKEFYTFAGDPGVSDLHCTKVSVNQMWIECKATGKKPSEDQENFMRDVNSTPSGIAFWADSFDRFLMQYNDIINGYGLSKGI